MTFTSFLIKYAEIGLKGKNRYKFEDALVDNIKKSLEDLNKTDSKNQPLFHIYKEQERIYLDINGEYDYDEVIGRLKRVFGIWTISPIYKVNFTDDYKKLSNEVLLYMKKVYGDEVATFKVKCKRINKIFPMHSDDINKELGHDILETFPNLTVDVHDPKIMLYIEIRKHINIYSIKIKGQGGLPIGTGGKCMLLLSGGIDSPVAGYMIAKRGVEVECIYYDSPPYTSPRARQKVIDLKDKLKKYIPDIKLNIVNFTDIQLAIYEKCPHDELTIIMRRIMMRIAEDIAVANGCKALITGESIGQVASQTVPSLVATNSAVAMPVFRPLIAFDKEEIVEKAKMIDTYNISIEPYEDCCTIFVATHPVTNPKLDNILRSETHLDNIEELIKTAENNITTL